MINLHNTFKLSGMILLIVFLLSASCKMALAENNPVNKDSTFNNGRIWKTDGYKVHFSEIRIGEGSMSYTPEGTKDEQLIGSEQVLKVEVEKGSYALEYGVGLAVAGFLGATVGVSTSNTEGVEPSNSAKNGIILGLTGVSGLIGAAIGSGQKKYEPVYTNPEFKPKTSMRITPEFDKATKTMGFRLSYLF
jgi:hypothetical protein